MVAIGLSSCCFTADTIEGVESQAGMLSCDIVEWSGNISFTPYAEVLSQLKRSRQVNCIHHYFPSHDPPVLVNLAHPDTCNASVKHVKRSLRLCNELEVPIYGVHAGYAINPKPSRLGRPQLDSPRIDMGESADLFFHALDQLLPEAERLGVKLLLENNVVAHYNFNPEDGNVYWLSSPETTLPILERYAASDLGVLLDVGHLDVSARTLEFDRLEYVELVLDRIREVHLSENDGLEDLNQPLNAQSWYWPMLANMPCLDLAILEVYGLRDRELGRQLELAQALSARQVCG